MIGDWKRCRSILAVRSLSWPGKLARAKPGPFLVFGTCTSLRLAAFLRSWLSFRTSFARQIGVHSREFGNALQGENVHFLGVSIITGADSRCHLQGVQTFRMGPHPCPQAAPFRLSSLGKSSQEAQDPLSVLRGRKWTTTTSLIAEFYGHFSTECLGNFGQYPTRHAAAGCW